MPPFLPTSNLSPAPGRDPARDPARDRGPVPNPPLPSPARSLPLPPYRATPDNLAYTLDAETIRHIAKDHHFDPPPELEPILLQQLASPDCSLTNLAIQHDTTVDALTLWMARPDIVERCRTIITGGMTQARMAIATRLNMCVKGLMVIVACAVETDTHTPAPISFHDRRLRELQRSNTIRAVNLILRVGRYDPFAPTRLYRTYTPPDTSHYPSTNTNTPLPNSNPNTYTLPLNHVPDDFSATLSPKTPAHDTSHSTLTPTPTPTHTSPTHPDTSLTPSPTHAHNTSHTDSLPAPRRGHAQSQHPVQDQLQDLHLDQADSDEQDEAIQPQDPRSPADPKMITNPRDWTESAEMGRQEIADRAATRRTPSPRHSIDTYPDSS